MGTPFLNFEGKTILVTGATSGIGKETASLINRLGGSLIITGRNKEKLESVSKELELSNYHVFPCDFEVSDSIDALARDIKDTIDQLDGIVHCVGIQITEPLRFIKEKSLQHIMQLNVHSAILLAKACRKSKLFHDGTSLIFMSSVVGLLGEAGMSAYAASKGAIIALTKSLASELAKEGVRVNCIAPAIVKTEMTEKMFALMSKEQVEQLEQKHLLGFGEPCDIANLSAFLLSSHSRWITGTCIVSDGGYSLT